MAWKFFGFKRSHVDQLTIFFKCRLAKVVACGDNASNLLRYAPSTSTANSAVAVMQVIQDVFSKGAPYEKKRKLHF